MLVRNKVEIFEKQNPEIIKIVNIKYYPLEFRTIQNNVHL